MCGVWCVCGWCVGYDGNESCSFSVKHCSRTASASSIMSLRAYPFISALYLGLSINLVPNQLDSKTTQRSVDMLDEYGYTGAVTGKMPFISLCVVVMSCGVPAAA